MPAFHLKYMYHKDESVDSVENLKKKFNLKILWDYKITPIYQHTI